MINFFNLFIITYGLTSNVFSIQDETGFSGTFTCSWSVWDSNTQDWSSTSNDDYSILTVTLNPTNGIFNKSTNLLVTVKTNFPAVNGGGDAKSPDSSKKGEFLFSFTSNGSPAKTGWILFNASNNQWHQAEIDQSELDIDWKWNDGSPKIEIKKK